MPAELLEHRNLASAVIELLRQMALARSWKSSTIAKAFGSVSGALQQLPLYTTQREPVYPERVRGVDEGDGSSAAFRSREHLGAARAYYAGAKRGCAEKLTGSSSTRGSTFLGNDVGLRGAIRGHSDVAVQGCALHLNSSPALQRTRLREKACRMGFMV